ncbi:(RS)-norcoclaurine 6-O-methyltransferase-like [Tasmannia lanceolata]|uniref:(RS)-norcoclaurine 6-O-methyltransferase-like n=1 Tax=Tasmannia lanceolata TaxID=3420 RepID=UPI00406419FB
MGLEAREELKNQELDDLALVWSHMVASTDSLVLKWTLDMSITDIIHRHGEPMTLSQVGASLPVPCGNYDILRRLMRYLVHMKLLRAQGDDLYHLTSASQFILVDDAKSLVPFARLIQQGDVEGRCQALCCLLEAKGATSAFETVKGEDMWSHAAKNAEHNKLFNVAMACDARLVTPALIDGCRDIFQGIKSLVDVGGGTGTASRGIAKAFPHIKCSILDLPHVVETIPDYPDVERVAGDMFSFIPRNDAVMMMKILHDWDDEDCVKILNRCKEAIPKEGGKVIIVDIVLDIDEGHEITRTRYAFDVIMMISTGGKERTEKEWRKLLLNAGFSQCEITLINALQFAIIASP